MQFKDLLEEWRAANDEARVAENVLSRRWQDYIERRGSPPSEAEIDEVKELRAIANDKLARAAQAMKKPQLQSR